MRRGRVRTHVATLIAVFVLMSLALPASAEACVNIGGDLKTGDGNFCDAHAGSKAIAVNGSDALAWGEGNMAIAINGGGAVVSNGEFPGTTDSKALGVNGGIADANDGVGNHAVAINESKADANGGSDSTAVAVNCSVAGASDDGEVAVSTNDGTGLCN